MSDDAETGLAGVDRFQLLVDSVAEYAIFVLDPDGAVASWNSGAQRIKGYTAEEIIGRHFSIFYPLRDIAAAKPQQALDHARIHGEYREEGWRVRRDGTTFWANVVITAVHGTDGELTGYAKVTRDDTERRAAEAATQRAVEAAVRANHAKDAFLSRMSHELRTPLNAILGFTQLLQMEDPDPAQRDGLAHILAAAAHLLDLINEVLDITMLETGSMRLSIEPVAVDQVVDQATAMLRPLAEHRGVRITLPSGTQGVYVRADRQRLKQVVVNLASNAVKYTREGTEVVLDAQITAGGHLRLSIRDHGPGIADVDLDRLFQPFERLGAALGPTEGTGLGLALSKHLVASMGGDIGLVRHGVDGCTFWVELPVTSVPTPATAPDESGDDSPRATTSAITVVYIEDNESNVALIERVFAHRPLAVLHVALDGQRGIELATRVRPDLVLVDLHLPDMTGEDVVVVLRGEPATANASIVALSADAWPDRQRRLVDLGADGYLAKPIDVARLLELIDTTVPGRRVGPRAASTASARAAGAQQVVAPPAIRVSGPFERFVHDLNNQLGIILNFANLLTSSMSGVGAAGELAVVLTATGRAIDLVRDLSLALPSP